MNNFYSSLFSFEFRIDGQESRDFHIWPVLDSKKKMNQFRLIPKNRETGLDNVIEQIGNDKSNAEPIFTFTSLTWFDFAFNIRDKKSLGAFPIYDVNHDSFNGRRSKILLLNLNNANQIDDINLNLSKGTSVGSEDFTTIIPNKFHLSLNETTSSINIKSIDPDNSINFATNISSNQGVKLDLESGIYSLEIMNFMARTERFMASTELLGTNAMGFIRIFKDETVDYDTSIQYIVDFSTT